MVRGHAVRAGHLSKIRIPGGIRHARNGVFGWEWADPVEARGEGILDRAAMNQSAWPAP